MADKEKEKAKVDLGLLEEDDEFEEFPAEGEILEKFDETTTMTNKKIFKYFSEWETKGENEEEELSVWEDNWDDDNLDTADDFNEQLKQQMSKK